MEEKVDDHMAARNLLVQNLLILVGVIAASEMSHTGRRVAGGYPHRDNSICFKSN